MKRFFTLLLLLSLAVFPFAVTAEEAETPVTEKAEPTLFDTRYYFEHRLLPQQFYEAPEETIASILQTGLYDRWAEYTEEAGADIGYTPKQFGAREMMQDSGIRMLMLTMPAPEKTLLCYRIYLCFDPDSGTAAYYTAEFDEKYDGFYDEGCLICGWKPDGVHQSYAEGRILPDRKDPEYEKALAEEATAILELMQQRIREDHPEALVRLT